VQNGKAGDPIFRGGWRLSSSKLVCENEDELSELPEHVARHTSRDVVVPYSLSRTHVSIKFVPNSITQSPETLNASRLMQSAEVRKSIVGIQIC